MLSVLKEPEFQGIMIGVLFGIIARVITLRTDYRQYPTYPHGKIIHMSLGVIAAGLGALIIPALVNKEYTAVTFLSLAAQQFRDVRKMERETLTKIDDLELVPRGTAYIEGIDRKSTRLNSSHVAISYAVFCSKKKTAQRI